MPLFALSPILLPLLVTLELFAIACTVGADLRVCHGGLYTQSVADTQVCPYTDLQTALGAGSPVAAQTKAGQTKDKPLAEYKSIIVEDVALDKNPKLAKFPAGHDTDFQKKIVADLQRKKVFAEVIDGTRQAGEREKIATSQAADNPASGKRLILSTTIIDFYPGNKALRYTVGLGMGATRVKARFVFRDAATGQEIWTHTQQGKFLGFITIHGTGKDYSVTEASGDIVDGLIRAINKNR